MDGDLGRRTTTLKMNPRQFQSKLHLRIHCFRSVYGDYFVISGLVFDLISVAGTTFTPLVLGVIYVYAVCSRRRRRVTVKRQFNGRMDECEWRKGITRGLEARWMDW